jgi:adenine-specific DNA-methyltransferase
MSNEQKITTDNLSRVTLGIKVPNKDLEALRLNFPHCFDKDGNFQIEKFKVNLTENEINFSTESYGLDWLGKSYARLLASDPATTLLKADETHNAKPENTNAENLLIKGDNLEVLKHLANAYYEQVKMIYIDPPYNTGSDGFVYNDDRKFTVRELQNLIGVDAEKAKRILSFTESNSNSHSAWLTFMYPRLYIAKQLLKDDGVIFISIDDNEVAQLRLLMDEVFGEENFVGELVWEKIHSTKNDAKNYSNNHEYILTFCKNINSIKVQLLERTEEMDLRYSNIDNDLRGPWASGDLVANEERKDGYFDIQSPNGNIFNVPKGKHWVYSKANLLDLVKDNRIWFGKDGNAFPRLKRFLSEVQQGRKASTLLLNKEVGHNQEARREINQIFNDINVFDTPKPIRLIKRILNLSVEKFDLILDFFAGSGTTGDAVMQLNAEDNGNRKFILVQLPEAIDPKKSKAAYDFVKDELKAEPTIFEITKERLLRAAKKTNTDLDAKITNLELRITKLKAELQTEETKTKIEELKVEVTQYLKRKTQNNFKIFETTPIWEDYDFEADELNSQIALFDESKLSEDDIKALLVTWKTYDGIALTQELSVISLESLVLSNNEQLKTNETQNSTLKTQNYIAYYGNGKLYLMDKGFTTDNLKTLLEKIDSDKNFDPKTIIAFGYHFESKSLRELSENLKSYKNKKGSDENLSFITRY